MCLENLILNEEWDDFYLPSDNPIEVKNYSKKEAYTIGSNQKIYFHDSVVIGLNDKVIYYHNDNSDSNILLEACKFENISSSGSNGGTVHFQSSGQIVENKICSTFSQLGSSAGVYTWHRVTQSDGYINYVVESSIVNSFSKDGGETIELYFGEMKLSNNNLTDSDTGYIAALYLYNPCKDANISFMKINNNIGRKINGCSHHYGNKMIRYSYCDISSNQCPELGIFYFSSNCDFSSCNIMNNAATTNYLFYMYLNSYKLTYSSCYINNPNANKNYQTNVNTNYQKPVDLPIFHFVCIGEIVSVQKRFQVTCNRESYCEKSIYKIIVFITS